MKFILSLAIALVAMATGVAGQQDSNLIYPPNGACWESNLQIMLSEASLAFNAAVLINERTYVICPGVYKIGTINLDTMVPGELVADGGEFPMVVFFPNFHLRCLIPGTCIYEGGQEQLMAPLPELALNLVEALVAEVFPTATLVSLYQDPEFELSTFIDSSRMFIRGMTFTKSNAAAGKNNAVVQLDNFGTGMEINRCVFKENGLETPSFAAIALSSRAICDFCDPFDMRDDNDIGFLDFLYTGLSIFNSNFTDNVFTYAVLSSLPLGANPFSQGLVSQLPTSQLELIRGTVANNTITATGPTGEAYSFASIISAVYSDVFISETLVADNVIAFGLAPIVLVESFFFEEQFGIFEGSNQIVNLDDFFQCQHDVLMFIEDSRFSDPSCECQINDPQCGCLSDTFFRRCRDILPEIVLDPPYVNATCWNSTLDILRSEVAAVFDEVLSVVTRTYNLCNQTTFIGNIDPATFSLSPPWADFPVIAFLPGLNLVCETRDYSCTFEGGDTQITNLVDNSLLTAFLALVPGAPPALPANFHVDSSNFRMRWFTFVDASDSCSECFNSPVEFAGPGTNMRIERCDWVFQNPSNPPFAAVQMSQPVNPVLKAGQQYYNSLALRNCFIGLSRFQFAPVYITFVGDGDEVPKQPGTEITFFDTTIADNEIISINTNDNSTLSRSGLVTAFFADVVLDGLTLVGNFIQQSHAPVVLINSNLFILFDSPVEFNTIVEDLSPDCQDAIFFNLSIQDGNFLYEEDGCLDYFSPPLPEPTSPPEEDAGDGFIIVTCFSGTSTVEVLDVGEVALKDIQIGQQVLVGDNTFEPVYSFGHFDPDTVADFLRIKTSSDATLEISADHMLFVEGQGAIPAALARVGDNLIASGDKNNESVTITSIKEVKARGLFAPFTPSGKVVVGGILASSFVALGESSPDASFFGVKFSHQWIAHSFEFPHRVACHYLGSCLNETYTKEGISTWVARPMDMAVWLLDQHFLVLGFIGGFLVSILAFFNALETTILHPVVAIGGLYLLWKRRGAGKKQV